MTAFLVAALLAFDETPEKTVRAFVDALNANDRAAAARRVVGQKTSSMPMGPGLPKLTVTLGETTIAGDRATVEADVEIEVGRTTKSREIVELRKVGDDWQIAPASLEKDGERRVIAALATLISDDTIFIQAKKAAKKTACLSNVKQLALGTMLYLADHSDVLPKSANWKTSIMPYVKNEAIFHCPEDTSGGVGYFLDPRVGGKAFAAIARPAETAMIVEGTPKKTAFRHAGMAALGFADGHAKIVKPEVMFKARTEPLK